MLVGCAQADGGVEVVDDEAPEDVCIVFAGEVAPHDPKQQRVAGPVTALQEGLVLSQLLSNRRLQTDRGIKCILS